MTAVRTRDLYVPNLLDREDFAAPGAAHLLTHLLPPGRVTEDEDAALAFGGLWRGRARVLHRHLR